MLLSLSALICGQMLLDLRFSLRLRESPQPFDIFTSVYLNSLVVNHHQETIPAEQRTARPALLEGVPRTPQFPLHNRRPECRFYAELKPAFPEERRYVDDIVFLVRTEVELYTLALHLRPQVPPGSLRRLSGPRGQSHRAAGASACQPCTPRRTIAISNKRNPLTRNRF
jgi:hypothetical protein